MTSVSPASTTVEPYYPSSDGQPVAETYDHLYVLLVTLEVLRQFLAGQQATVLGNQFLYYSQGYPRLRVAPDVMVIFDVEPGGWDNYKIWEEGQVPSVIFEMTSAGTREQDDSFKRNLYAQIGVREYWQFDPKAEWVLEQLRGFRLRDQTNLLGEAESIYEPISNGHSQVLGLRLESDGKLINFYRLDNGEKLLIPGEMSAALDRESQARLAAEQKQAEVEAKNQVLETKLAQYREKFGEIAED